MTGNKNTTDSKSSTETKKYTPQQRQAIETRDCSIALSAGAGCGKTFVLTERFLSEIDPRQGARDLAGLVAITFTERAAREMRSRIRSACRDRLRLAPNEEIEYWLKIVRDVDSARISTIHSFCGSLLRANAPQVGIDPQFVVLERGVADPLRRMAVEESAERLLLDRSPSAMQLIREVGLEKLMSIADRLIQLRFQLRDRDWEKIGPEGLAELWNRKFHSEHLPKIERELQESEEIGKLLKLLDQFHPEDGVMLERRERLLELLRLGPEAGNGFAWLNELREQARIQGAGKKAWPSDDVKLSVKKSFEVFRKWIDSSAKELQFVDDDLLRMAKIGYDAYVVSLDAIRRYEVLKRGIGGLDFDDLLTLTRDLLQSSKEVRIRTAAGIDFLMVDEFQDTDPTQADIVRALVGDGLKTGKVFLVGDAQQSIYRFRNADPRVFAALQQEIPSRGRLPLTGNFRSQPEILNFVNALFGGDPKSPYEPLIPFDPKQYSPTPAVEFLFSHDDPESADSVEIRRIRESEWIAGRIRQLLADPTPRIRDSSTGTPPFLRPVRAGDIVILFRSLNDVQIYESSLRHANVEYYLVGGKAFYSQQEVFDIANLCRFLNDPTDHVSLLGLLRSPFCNLSDDTIFAVWRKGKDLWKGLLGEPPGELGEFEQGDVKRAAKVLTSLLNWRDRLPIARLLRMALDLTGYDAALLTEFLGERKLANLEKLIEMARAFDRVGLFGLPEFVEQLNTAVLEESDEELAATHPEAGNVVRLMTIHQSKGLEFPVVIVADMDRESTLRTPEAVFDADLGTLVSPPVRHGRKLEHIGLKMYLAREKREEQAEAIRLLYVAVTRAADHLILSGALKNQDHPRSIWMKKLASRFDLRTASPLRAEESDEFVIPEPYSSRLPLILAHPEQPTFPQDGNSGPRGIPLAQFLPSVLEAAPETPSPRMEVDRSRNNETRVVSISELESALNPEYSSPSEFPTQVEPAVAEELGILIHRVLERLDFSHPETLESVIDTIGSTSRKPLNSDLRDPALKLIRPFLETSAARQIAEARKSFCELDFLLRGNDLISGCDGLFISGTIDRLFETPQGEWIIADFKTGRRLLHDHDRLRAQYELQMGLYAFAVQQVLGRLPHEIWLIQLRQSDPVVKYDVDEQLLSRVGDAARRAIELIRNRSQSS